MSCDEILESEVFPVDDFGYPIDDEWDRIAGTVWSIVVNGWWSVTISPSLLNSLSTDEDEGSLRDSVA